MATSGSTDFSVNCLELIKAAMRQIGELAKGETPDDEDVTNAREALNMLIKQWSGLTHTLKMWLRKELAISLTSSAEYTLKIRRLAFTGGGTTAVAVGDTITGATSSATATVCCVTLSSGAWADGDAAGELLIYGQDGTFESENLNTGSGDNLATIAENSTKYGPFNEVVEAVLRNSDDQDSPLQPMTEAQYMAIGSKQSTGTPQKYFVIKKADEIIIKLNVIPSVTTSYLILVVKRQVEDFDANTNDIDMPVEWYRAMKFNLAVEIAPEFEADVSKILAFLASDSLEKALTFEPEQSEMYFQPGKY
jgi:hypothetical protein